MIGGEAMPCWIQMLQASATPVIAGFAVVIGVFQWRTAHQRAVLDLFERRMTVFDSIREVVGEISRTGNVTNDDISNFDRATDKVSFLFKKEVRVYLDDLRETMISHHALDNREDEKSLDARDRHFAKIGLFHDEFGRLLLPYMRMHQKAPWF